METLMQFDSGDEFADIVSHDTYVAGVPHTTFKRMREQAPVQWVQETNGSGFWAVTGYPELLEVARDYRRFTAELGIRLEEMDAEETDARRSMMELDPPRHTRLRRLVQRGFTKRMVETYEAAFRLLTAAVFDDVFARATEFDFVEEISRELPMRLLCRLLGVPDDEARQLVEWGDGMIANTDSEFTDHVVDQTDTEEFRLLPFRSPSALKVIELGARAAAQRRLAPGDDIISTLLSTPPDGEPLTDAEFYNFFALLVVAGNETTRHTITHGLLAMMAHPDQMQLLIDNPDVGATAADEILRWSSVTMHFRRTATVDTVLGGQSIAAGDKVVMYYIAANFDERQFPEPYRFDVTRSPNDHVAFGYMSAHRCLGEWLARLEVRVTFDELFKRVTSIEATGPALRLRSNFVSGIKHLPVRVELNS